jgi:hypothetical protein
VEYLFKYKVLIQYLSCSGCRCCHGRRIFRSDFPVQPADVANEQLLLKLGLGRERVGFLFPTPHENGFSR